MSVDRLLAQHCRILANVDAVEQFAMGATPDAEGMPYRRWTFTRDLLLHFAQMESMVYGPMVSDCREHARQAAARASVETAELMSAYREYVARWASQPIGEQWESHRRAALSLMRRVRTRIEEEAMEIIPLLPVQPEGERPAPTRESYAAEAWEIHGVIFDAVE